MTRAKVVLPLSAVSVLALATFGALAASQPSPGSLQKMVTLEAWVPDTAMAAMLDAGVPLTHGTHYQTLKARFWYFLDGGLDTGPNWPSGVVIIQKAGPTICSSSQVCVAYDGGIDPALATASGCFCSSGASCNATYDGGVFAAPTGITIPGAGWSNASGAGCIAKPCGDLWTNLPDGGADSSWPAACPAQ